VDVVAANVPAPCSKGQKRADEHVDLQIGVGAGVIHTDHHSAEELLYVSGKLSMVLEQETMRGVGVDLDLRARNQSGE